MKRFSHLSYIILILLAGNPGSAAVAQPAAIPHDTLFITAAIPYEGLAGTGEAYVYLADSLASLARPIVVVEGFDLDNNWDWDELYNHLNQEDLLETIRSEGYDIVALNFSDATDYIQRNSFVVVELIQQVQAVIDPSATLVVSGASMGGLCARYALAYMETHGLDHRVRTFISFDAPHLGANIPLGIQYWVDFFSGLSDAAAGMRDKLNRPAARQMLVYHFTDPPGSTGEPDPLRAGLLADFAGLGDYPQNLRKVAIANGNGQQLGQGFAAGEQIIQYEYSDLLTTIRGNVWAVPDASSQLIFDGHIRIIIIPTSMAVTVSGTKPFDNAPGGWRSSMADMDSTEAPYGDILALHEHHCFIPTISALAVETDDLFYDVAGDPDLLSHTPFDTVYYPAVNQDHASITAENALWFIMEVRDDATGVRSDPGPSLTGTALYQNYPNPFNPFTTISFTLPEREQVRLSVYNIEGKIIAHLVSGVLEGGYREAVWDGADAGGNPVSSGVYFYRLETSKTVLTRKMVLLK